MGLLKAKLAKYRSQLLEPAKKGEKGEGFDVLKSGDARVALIGFPSVGKVCDFHFKHQIFRSMDIEQLNSFKINLSRILSVHIVVNTYEN